MDNLNLLIEIRSFHAIQIELFAIQIYSTTPRLSPGLFFFARSPRAASSKLTANQAQSSLGLGLSFIDFAKHRALEDSADIFTRAVEPRRVRARWLLKYATKRRDPGRRTYVQR